MPVSEFVPMSNECGLSQLYIKNWKEYEVLWKSQKIAIIHVPESQWWLHEGSSGIQGELK